MNGSVQVALHASDNSSSSSFLHSSLNDTVTVTGLIRRRRDFSKLLSFFTLEVISGGAFPNIDISSASSSSSSSSSSSTTTTTTNTSEPPLPPSSLLSIQLKCAGWMSPRTATVGTKVRAIGIWDAATNNSDNTENADNNTSNNTRATPVSSSLYKRLLVDENSLTLIEDEEAIPAKPKIAARNFASEHELWRAKVGASCQCSDILCPRSHGDSIRWKERNKLLEQMREAKRSIANSDSSDAHKEPLASKTKHNLVFAKWIVDTFSQTILDKGVADIAGGRGLIALELALEYNIHPVTLIEPKPVKLNTTYRRRVKRWRQRKAISGASATTASTICNYDVSALDHRVKASGGSIDNVNNNVETSNCNEDVDGNEDANDIDNEDEDFNINSNTSNNSNNSSSSSKVNNQSLSCIIQYEEEFYGVDSASEKIRAALESCGLIVAMHPDAATGAVVEAAVQLNKPVAVVPCCVFANMFPDRFTPRGTVVSTYEELLDYLQSKMGPNARRISLPFEGRNIVLYSNNTVTAT